MGLQRCNIISAFLLDAWFEIRHWGKVSSAKQHLEDLQHKYITYWKRKWIICNLTMVLSACLRALRRICFAYVDNVTLFFQSAEKRIIETFKTGYNQSSLWTYHQYHFLFVCLFNLFNVGVRIYKVYNIK